jgi:hypothetical protein
MEQHSKLQIYKGMIHYLLETTDYTLKNIADLSNSSTNNLHSIYCNDQLPEYFPSELRLVKLYHIILECNITQNTCRKYVNKINKNSCHKGVMKC